MEMNFLPVYICFSGTSWIIMQTETIMWQVYSKSDCWSQNVSS
jgi:hypothetical protein